MVSKRIVLFVFDSVVTVWINNLEFSFQYVMATQNFHFRTKLQVNERRNTYELISDENKKKKLKRERERERLGKRN